MKTPPLSILELFLIEAIVYIVLWLWNEYVASIMTLSFCAIAFFILAISLISELIERSKVPRWYFTYMTVSILTPLVIGAFFLYLNKGSFAWMKGL
jgi:ABC-type arginine/histidine transport system permease subunit